MQFDESSGTQIQGGDGTASVNQALFKQQQFTLICALTIANFEGQLAVDPDQMEIDEAEYREILQRL